MTRWRDVPDNELGQRLADELKSTVEEHPPAADWARLQLLPAVRREIEHRPVALPGRSSPVLGPVSAVGAVAVLGLLLLVIFARPDTGRPAGTPEGASNTVRSGDFSLTITSAKSTYTTDGPLEIEAVLAYSGSEEQVELGHAQPMIAFGFAQLDGTLRMGPGWEEICDRTTIGRDQPIRSGLRKSASWSPDDPDAGFYEAWALDPTSGLPSGTWEITAYAEPHLARDCSGPNVEMAAPLLITVVGEEPVETPPPTIVALGSRDFASRVASGELHGRTVLVTGVIERDPSGEYECLPEEPCRMGQLAGTEPRLDVHVRSITMPIPTSTDAPPWRWERPEAPRDGTLVLHVDADGIVEYLGRTPAESMAFTISEVRALDVESLPLDEVIVVPGWLVPVLLRANHPCFGRSPNGIAGLPGRREDCGGTWLLGQPPDFDIQDWEVDGLQVQDDAQVSAAPEAGVGGAYPGAYVLARRLDGYGCPGENPCWRWNVIDSIDSVAPEPIGPTEPSATPPPTEPLASPTPSAPSLSAYGHDMAQTSAGTFELEVRANGTEHVPGQPIDVVAELLLPGDVTVWGDGLRLTYVQLDGDLRIDRFLTHAACNQSDLRLSDDTRISGHDGRGLLWVDDRGPNAELLRRWRDSEFLWLPAGRWEITARASFSLGPGGCGDEEVSLGASVLLDVREPGDSTAPPAPTPYPAEPTELACQYLDEEARQVDVSVSDHTGDVRGCSADRARPLGERLRVSNGATPEILRIDWDVSPACEVIPAQVSVWPASEYGTKYVVVVDLAGERLHPCQLGDTTSQGVLVQLERPVSVDDVEVVLAGEEGVAADTSAGTFWFRLDGDRSTHAAAEPIHMSAVLAYVGPDDLILSGPTLAPGMRYTQLDGHLQMETGSALICNRLSTEPIMTTSLTTKLTPFVGFENEPSTIDWYRAWSESDFLWLPEGTWLVEAFADFHIGPDCGDERVMLTTARVLTITGTSP